MINSIKEIFSNNGFKATVLIHAFNSKITIDAPGSGVEVLMTGKTVDFIVNLHNSKTSNALAAELNRFIGN